MLKEETHPQFIGAEGVSLCFVLMNYMISREIIERRSLYRVSNCDVKYQKRAKIHTFILCHIFKKIDIIRVT